MACNQNHPFPLFLLLLLRYQWRAGEGLSMPLAMPLKIGLLALSRVVMGGRDMGRRFTTTLITCGCWIPVEGNAAFALVSLLTVMVEESC
jgi:hypothetical protein